MSCTPPTRIYAYAPPSQRIHTTSGAVEYVMVVTFKRSRSYLRPMDPKLTERYFVIAEDKSEQNEKYAQI